MMKTKLAVVLVVIGAVAMGVVGCTKTASNPMPPLNPGYQGRLVEVSYDDLLADKHINQEIELVYPESLMVSLASNPSTGYAWSENAIISDTTVLSQTEHNVVAPANSMPGSPGKEAWTFKPVKKGTATITLSYSQPWEGGAKNEWTFDLKVTVK